MATSDELREEARKEASNESSVEIETTDDDKWIKSILEEGDRPINASSDKQLQKVQRELREEEENKGYFDPRVVSIGPYHHGKPGLKEAEKLKIRAVYAFVDGNEEKLHEIYKKMVQVVSDARKCYIDGSTDAYDDVAFARMMLRDGCFILQFIYEGTYGRGYVSKYRGRPFKDELKKHVSLAGYRARIVDIILLENQLPFLVLQALISSTSSPEGEWEQLIENFILQKYIDNKATWREQTYRHEKEQPLHLLDLMWKRFLRKYSPSTEEEVVIRSSKKVHQDGPPLPRFSFKTIISCGHWKTNPIQDSFSHSFRSSIELKARGIHFRPSTTFFLNDFNFTSRFGYGLLTLPRLPFGWRMKYILLNMMAYELAPSEKMKDPEVCSYIYFMNSLINGAEDVMELRTHNIIHNFYGTDEELAKVFNSMATGGAYLSYKGPIKEVSDQIQKHYNSRMKTWTAQLLHNYFSNPWSAVAFFAATFALVLTFISTFFPR